MDLVFGNKKQAKVNIWNWALKVIFYFTQYMWQELSRFPQALIFFSDPHLLFDKFKFLP